MTSIEETEGSIGALRIDGNTPIDVDADNPREAGDWTIVRDTLGFECASGDWIEREWVGIPVFELLTAAEVPGTTTHIQLISADGARACVPLTALDDAIIAIGESDGLPRFVSPHVIGPRTVKNLSRIRPLALTPSESREAYEQLPLDEE